VLANFACVSACATRRLWQGCRVRVRVGARNAAAVAGLPSSRARCGGCCGVADFVRVDMRDVAAAVGLLTWWARRGGCGGLPSSRACRRARYGGCGGAADFACVWTCVTWRLRWVCRLWARRGGSSGVATHRGDGDWWCAHHCPARRSHLRHD
jgi:hypothetical protein